MCESWALDTSQTQCCKSSVKRVRFSCNFSQSIIESFSCLSGILFPQWLPAFMMLALERLTREVKTSEFRVLLLQVVSFDCYKVDQVIKSHQYLGVICPGFTALRYQSPSIPNHFYQCCKLHSSSNDSTFSGNHRCYPKAVILSNAIYFYQTNLCRLNYLWWCPRTSS